MTSIKRYLVLVICAFSLSFLISIIPFMNDLLQRIDRVIYDYSVNIKQTDQSNSKINDIIT